MTQDPLVNEKARRMRAEAKAHRGKAEFDYLQADQRRADYGQEECDISDLLTTAIEELYQATRKDLYASMLEGKEKELERCIQLNPKRIIHAPEAQITTRYYDFVPRPQENYAIRKEEAVKATHAWKCKVRKKREEDEEKERLKQLESEFPTDFKKNLTFKF